MSHWGNADTSQKPARASGSLAGSSGGGCGELDNAAITAAPQLCALRQGALGSHNSAAGKRPVLNWRARDGFQGRKSLVHGDSTAVSSGSAAAAVPGVGELASPQLHPRAPDPGCGGSRLPAPALP